MNIAFLSTSCCKGLPGLIKKVYAHCDKQHSQYTVEKACPVAAHILYHKLCVAGSEKPVGIQQSSYQRDSSQQHEKTLYNVVYTHKHSPEFER